jgi:hypothetical protein
MDERKRRWYEDLFKDEMFVPWTLILCMGLVSIVGLIAYFREPKPAETVVTVTPATKDDVANAVKVAETLMPDLEVTELPVAIIQHGPDDTVLTYLIEAKKTNDYWFEVTDYRLPRGVDWNTLGVAEFYKAIDRAYERGTKIPDEIKVSLGATVGTGPASVTGTVEAPWSAIEQAFGFVHGVMKLEVARVDVAIRGYADGETQPGWKMPVPSLPVDFQKFPVLRSTDEAKDQWLFYEASQQERGVSYPYANDDLPDLRARYIQRQFVELLVPKSRNADRCHVYILHNRALLQPNQKEWRKAQIYVMVYLKREA